MSEQDLVPSSGGGGTPGGSSGQIQGNNAGSFAGVPNSTINFSTGAVQLQSAVVAVTTTTKTFALTDENTLQDCNNAAAQTLTIPLNASVAFPLNAVIAFEQNGAGPVTIVGATGVIVNGVSAGSVTIGGQFTTMYARQESTDVWYIEGGANNGSFSVITTTGPIKQNIALNTLAGTTAGSVLWSQPLQGSATKEFVAHAAAYENNSASNQTITFPTPFTYTPTIVANDTGLTLTVSTTILTITAPNSVTTYTGNIIVKGI